MTSRPTLERDILIPTRDSLKLAADVYRPDDRERHPVLIQRTPYNKSNLALASRMFNPIVAAERGYVVVVQDVRGRFRSAGEWVPFVNEANDGYDTIEWAAKQPWSDGNIGIYGGSYVGVTALQAALSGPPHLKACSVFMTGANYHNGWTYESGAFQLGFNFWWTWHLYWHIVEQRALGGAESESDERHELEEALLQVATDPWQAIRRPLNEIEAFKSVAPFWSEWLSHSKYDNFWQKIDVAARAAEIKVPVLQIAGWYDIFLRGHLDLHQKLSLNKDSSSSKSNHLLIVGPWNHEAFSYYQTSMVGEVDFGPKATVTSVLGSLPLQWFDHWLTGKETPLTKNWSHSVRYFVTGENDWRESDSWPPSQSEINYYLHSCGKANSRFGDGALSREMPDSDPPDGYVYDALNPVPTVGGRILHPFYGRGGIWNQAEVEKREDVLVYTSPILTTPLAVVGPAFLTLFASSSALDTDFTAKLVDLAPNGYCANIADGIIRVRYRDGVSKEVLMEPGKVYDFNIDLCSIAHVFFPRHSLRLEISSSNFPKYDLNLSSTGTQPTDTANPSKVVQNIFHSTQYPSHLALPVLQL